MVAITAPHSVEARVANIAQRGIELPQTDGASAASSHPVWTRLNELGTELWLDTGDLEDAGNLWSAEFTALTTNNSLLAKEVGKGIYDALIRDAIGELRATDHGVQDDTLIQEIGIALNAHHGLRLVERFACKVSVELHTDLAHDFDGSLAVARRLFAICPSHFIIKVPLTPTGILIARRLASEHIPVNFTLEFSARQNCVVASIANPDFVNVFLGRLNSFVSDHGLGDGKMVGEKATLASQRELRSLRDRGGKTRQIAASMREAEQVLSLAGVDVFTMPTGVAKGMPGLDLSPDRFASQVLNDPTITTNEGVNAAFLDVLWAVPAALKSTLEALAAEPLDSFSGSDLAAFFADRGFGDLFPQWSDSDLESIADDGKIPSYERWRTAFEDGAIGLDAALNAAGHAAFAADQLGLDERIRSML